MRVAVLLERHPGDARWAALVPAIEGCLAEGVTPEAAIEAIIPEIQYFLDKDPGLIDILRDKLELLLTEVEVPVDLDT